MCGELWKSIMERLRFCMKMVFWVLSCYNETKTIPSTVPNGRGYWRRIVSQSHKGNCFLSERIKDFSKKDGWEASGMSDFTKNDNASMNRYPESISEMTQSVQGICTGNYSNDELRFVVFCIESLAEDMNVDPVIVHDALTKESDIVDQYIIPCYETLHTQGKEYIVENLKEVMAERGIVL